MSLPRYAKYKDSGAVWLGNVPSHWTVKKLGYEFVEPPCYGVLVPDFEAGGVPMIRIMDMQQGKVARDELTTISLELSSQYTRTLTKTGDVLLSVVGTIGEVVHVDEYLSGVNLSRAVARLQPNDAELNRSFLGWLLQSNAFSKYVDLVCVGSAQRVLNMGDLSSFRAGIPPVAEQTTIATFLDRETGKIDALIAEQEKLLTLLAEKRQATISHAVTKGLNPDVPMKDSGVAWLGEVPAHWEIKQLRHIAKIVRGASPRPAGDPKFFSEDAEGNTPWVTVAEVTKDMGTYLDSVKEYLTPLGVEQSQLFDCGTLVFTNSGATLGVPKILDINCCANDGILAFRDLVPTVNIVFAYSFLLTTTERLRTEMKQGGGQPNLNTDIVKNIGFALPPLNEQSEIVAFLSQELERLDALGIL